MRWFWNGNFWLLITGWLCRYLYGNKFTSLPANVFSSLGQCTSLFVGLRSIVVKLLCIISEFWGFPRLLLTNFSFWFIAILARLLYLFLSMVSVLCLAMNVLWCLELLCNVRIIILVPSRQVFFSFVLSLLACDNITPSYILHWVKQSVKWHKARDTKGNSVWSYQRCLEFVIFILMIGTPPWPICKLGLFTEVVPSHILPLMISTWTFRRAYIFFNLSWLWF